MRRASLGMAIGLLLSSTALAANTPPVRRSTPRIHNSACALAESMASKLSGAKMTQETAQKSCQALAPTMSAADHAEFMRCCIQRMVTGAPSGQPQPQQPADGTQRM